MRINWRTIPHKQHRLADTIGDYWFTDDGTLQIRVSKLEDEDMEFLVGLHELVEALLCERTGVSTAQVDAWDKAHPPIDDYDEPGDRPDAPYARQHAIACAVERLAATLIGVNYQQYDNYLGEMLKKHA